MNKSKVLIYSLVMLFVISWVFWFVWFDMSFEKNYVEIGQWYDRNVLEPTAFDKTFGVVFGFGTIFFVLAFLSLIFYFYAKKWKKSMIVPIIFVGLFVTSMIVIFSIELNNYCIYKPKNGEIPISPILDSRVFAFKTSFLIALFMLIISLVLEVLLIIHFIMDIKKEEMIEYEENKKQWELFYIVINIYTIVLFVFQELIVYDKIRDFYIAIMIFVLGFLILNIITFFNSLIVHSLNLVCYLSICGYISYLFIHDRVWMPRFLGEEVAKTSVYNYPEACCAFLVSIVYVFVAIYFLIKTINSKKIISND